jgi:CO/xanthine dehydrogenase Mo-binding subunit
VLTNTPPRGPQRGPGENQLVPIIEPIMDKAARELGVDRIALRRINAPDMNAKYGENQGPVTSAYLKDALDIVAQRFGWEEKKALSGQRNGSKVTGIGIGQAYHGAGNNGFDGLARITPDGMIHIHTGIGNLGTHSYFSCSRVVAEVLGAEWDNCIIERGDTRRGIPWTVVQAGSNTTFTMSRAMYVVAQDIKQKLLEIAAMDLGGAPEDYDLKNETVVNKADGSKSMTFAQAAQRAIELGGKYAGFEVPEDINDITKRAVEIVAGTGLVGATKDNLPREGQVPGLTVGMAQVEVDTETGKVDILSYISVADVGTVMHPMGLSAQLSGGGVMGFGMALTERYIYDPQNGIPANLGFHDFRPMTYLDVPTTENFAWDAVNKADPQNPVGGRGVGEPAEGSGAAAVVSAVSDALGGYLFNRTPIVPDMIVNVSAGRPQSVKPLAVNTQ